MVPSLVDPAPASSWSGFYYGVNAGVGSASWHSMPFSDEVEHVLQLDGLTGGGQIGYNWVQNGLVLGIQADANLTSQSASKSFPDADSAWVDDVHLDWTAAFTGRIGMPVGRFLPYVLAGVALAHVTNNVTREAPYNVTGDFSASHFGGTLGVGVATQISDGLTAFVEARYSNYGTANYQGEFHFSGGGDAGTLPFNASLVDATIVAGVNIHY
jgi:opacity protein-like surface antigen